MFCPNCGSQVNDNADICLTCGVIVKQQDNKIQKPTASSGWWWLGFFFPLVGFIIWVCCNNSEPEKAKKAGKGAIFGLILNIVFTIAIYVIFFGIGFIFSTTDIINNY